MYNVYANRVLQYQTSDLDDAKIRYELQKQDPTVKLVTLTRTRKGQIAPKTLEEPHVAK